MTRQDQWNFDDLDTRTRRAVLAASRKAGLGVAEWLDRIVSEQAQVVEAAPADELDGEARLDSVIARIGGINPSAPRVVATRKPARRETPAKSAADQTADMFDALEKRLRAREDKTAEALSNVSDWIAGQEARMRRLQETVANLEAELEAIARQLEDDGDTPDPRENSGRRRFRA